MEVALVRQRVLRAIDRARRAAAERRALADEAAREYDHFLDRIAVPLFRQIANVLRAEGYPFTVFTPGGSVRLTSDRSAEDFIELTLETGGDRPAVMCRASRARGRRVIEAEGPIAQGPVRELTEDRVLEAVLRELEPLVER